MPTPKKHKVINAPTLMLDSGAFSAWSKGISIDIQQYGDFILEHLDWIDYIVNLDVIPGRPGMTSQLAREGSPEFAKCADAGWDNYWYLRDRGVPRDKLIHVFHQYEPISALERMIPEVPYLGLSPANDTTTPQKIAWLKSIMPVACDKNGLPLNKWHGFAVTSLPIMLAFPWYSVDSTSWVATSRLGGVLVPRHKNGKPQMLADPIRLQVSTRSPGQRQLDQHYSTLAPQAREVVDQFIELMGFRMGVSTTVKVPDGYQLGDGETWVGGKGSGVVERVSEPGIANSYIERDLFNIKYFAMLQDAMPAWPWAYREKQTGLGL